MRDMVGDGLIEDAVAHGMAKDGAEGAFGESCLRGDGGIRCRWEVTATAVAVSGTGRGGERHALCDLEVADGL